jgi:peptidoglycan/LPS O-acetylase OafA/YrhL
VAVLLVVAFHIGKLLREERFVPGGFIGVDLFFVLSGFLIASLLFEEHGRRGGISLRRFYARRACRLLPALYVYLLAHLLYWTLRGFSLRDELRAIAAIVLYVSNLAQSAGEEFPRALIHTWSLGVEEQFYLLCPIALVWLLRARPSPRTVVALLLAGAAASALIRMWVWHRGSGYPAAYMRPDARFDGLLIGMAAAQAWRHDLFPHRWLAGAGSVGAGVIVAVALATQSDAEWMFYGGYTLISVAGAAVVLAVAHGAWRLAAALDAAPLRAVGRVSYALYLWHVLVIFMVSQHLGSWPRPLQALLALVGSAVVTAASWLLVETPFLRLKERWSMASPEDARQAASPSP